MNVESMPKTVIWAGVGACLLGGILIATGPVVVNSWWVPNTEAWQSATQLLSVILVLARTLLAPLGAALIGAGLVMVYVDGRLRGERISDRPRRWRFPPPEEEQAAARR
jgi:hypothetical protein